MAPSPSQEHHQFVLIPKSHTDGISLRKDGPLVTKEFATECSYGEERSFRTAASFVPKQVPKHFITTLTMSDELTYYECIVFERRTVMKEFSETVNVFLPKETKFKYVSSLFFDPDATSKCYVVGTELIPAKKFVVVAEESPYDGDATECDEKREINGDIGECQKLISAG